MKLAFVMDSLASVRPEKDTSYWLMVASCVRGHEVFHIDQNQLECVDHHVVSRAQKVHAKYPGAPAVRVEGEQLLSLDDCDVVFVRKDPPFDRRYFYTTLLLDRLHPRVRVINSPQALRDWNEKLAALEFSEFTPRTLVSSSPERIREFVESEKRAILKPIDGHGGRGIELLQWGDRDLEEKIWRGVTSEAHKVMVQEFVEAAALGDKRILLVAGEPIGAILRVAGTPGGLNNLDQGGHAEASELSEVDRRVCQALRPHLLERGLYFVGIDMLGSYLTEINVTSPTGLRELCEFDGQNYHYQMIEQLENGAQIAR